MLNEYAVWRALHVLAVVFWIGGVAFVTTILLPALRRQHGDYALFELLEHRFGWQAKVTTTLTFISGLAMLWATDSWSRLLTTWWLWLMLITWLLFTLMLFVLEPFLIHRWLHRRAQVDRAGTLMLLQRLHYGLLALSVLTVLGGVAGAHGGIWL